MMPTDTNTEYVSAVSVDPGAVSAGSSIDPEDSVNLLDLALVLAIRKRFILLCGFLAAVVTAIIVLVIPVSFTATTTMLPPQQSNSASALLGSLGGLASLAGGVGGGGGGGGAASMLGLKNPADMYIGLLHSETIADNLIDRFHLMQIYKVKRMGAARKDLKSSTKILAEKSSLISISVKDHDPRRAADVANGYIDALHELMSHLAITEAAQRRLFFEQQLELEKNKLADAEVALEVTENKTGIIQPQGQAEAVIMTITQLRAQISATEVELSALRTSATDQNSQVIQLQSQIEALRAQLVDFEKGHAGSAKLEGNILTPTSQVPAASLEYLRKMRDVRYHETLFELLARQYEMAKVDEAKEGQMIQVVDPALVPEKKSWPPRALLMLFGTFLGVMLASFWVILQAAYRQKMEDPETAQKITQLRQTLRARHANQA